MSTIEHLILLDLLGAPRPLIRSSFIDTAWLFDEMASAEQRLRSQGAFSFVGENSDYSFFLPRTTAEHGYGYVEDDHIPFLRKGVDVLHVIANPFPRVWHTLAVSNMFLTPAQLLTMISKDDASALDVPTMRRWNLILRVFMCEYLGLNPARIRASGRRATDELVSSKSGDGVMYSHLPSST
jgi:glutaminyl-peptide cyclotransferase